MEFALLLLAAICFGVAALIAIVQDARSGHFGLGFLVPLGLLFWELTFLIHAAP